MPLTFTAPIEQVPEQFVVTYQPRKVRPAIEMFTTSCFPPMQTAEAIECPRSSE